MRCRTCNKLFKCKHRTCSGHPENIEYKCFCSKCIYENDNLRKKGLCKTTGLKSNSKVIGNYRVNQNLGENFD